MDEQQNAIEILRKSKNMRTKQQVRQFRKGLDMLNKYGVAPASLPELFLILDDQTLHQELIQTIFAYIESFDYRWQIDSLISVTNEMVDSNPSWLRKCYTIFIRDKECRLYMQAVIDSLSENKRSIIHNVIRSIPNTLKDPDLRQQISEEIEQVLVPPKE